MKLTLGAIAALFVFASITLADGVPVRTRSGYGQAGSLILATSTETVDGATISSQEFCSDAITNPSNGTCQLAFAFQITSLPANTQSLTITLPVPTGSSLNSSDPAGILTNDDTVQNGDIFFSPFSQTDLSGLPSSAIVFGTDASGNPTVTILLPLALSGDGTGLSLYLNVSDNNSLNGDGLYCYQVVSGGCTATDIPSIPQLGVNLQTTTVAAPEPASLSLLASGLLGLGLVGRKRVKR